MSREEDDRDGALRLSIDGTDSKKMKPPNKKKFDEDMDGLTSQIKEKEAELERVRQAVAEIKLLKTERMECVNNRKQIVIDLERVNKEIPERMKRLNEIEASLYYKNEDKINSAIQRLEWNLNVKTYKLTEEKKIVSEIDSLKRSKKNLVQYLTLKQEISEIRDKQKGLRDGRDKCTKDFNKLKAKEEEVRSKNRSLIAIKREIDALYEQRRQTNANFKQQRGEFHELKEKHKKESWKKKAGDRKVFEEDTRQDWSENEPDRLPHESDVLTCVTLTSYLNHLLPSATDMSHDSLSPASSQDDPEPAEDIDDGHYKLLRKSDDAETLDLHHQGVGGGGGLRRINKRSKKFRKLALDKKLAHPPDILTQFLSLNLTPPSCLYEVPDVVEQLEKKRAFFEKEQQHLNEAASDTGISATESALCVMSRQASKTESCEGGVQDTSGSGSSRPDDSVYAELFQQQQESGGGDGNATKLEDLCGAVGGRSEDDDWSSVTVGVGSDTPNSDSTVEGDTGSGDSPKSKPEMGTGKEKRAQKDTAAIHDHHHRPLQKQMPSPREKRGEMKRSLAVSASDSTDSSSLVDQQPSRVSLLAEDDFPSLLDSSQTSLLSEASFPSLGTSGASGSSHWHEISPGNESSYKKAAVASSSSLSGMKSHLPLTKTYSVIPHDSSSPSPILQINQQQQQQQTTMPKSKSYASSVVSRARSFSEAMSKSRGNNSSNLNQSSSSDEHPAARATSKQIQPPSSLSISPASVPINVKQPAMTPTLSSSSSSKPIKPSLYRSRTLTPTLTRTWAEVRDRHRKSSGNSSGSGGGGGNASPSGSFSSNSGIVLGNKSTPSATSPPNPKSPGNTKTQASPSLSSSAIPSPHKSSLSPRLSYPLQSKPSVATPPPMIVIDRDRDFPPLSPAMAGGGGGSVAVAIAGGGHNNSSRRNSSLSTKSSSGSLTFHDRDASTPSHNNPSTTMTVTATTSTSDNNNNNSSSSNSYLDMTTGSPYSPSPFPCHYNTNVASPPNTTPPTSYHYNVVAASASSPSTRISTSQAGTDRGASTNILPDSTVSGHTQDSNLSSLPKGDKSSTEKWVESSMAFCRENATTL